MNFYKKALVFVMLLLSAHCFPFSWFPLAYPEVSSYEDYDYYSSNTDDYYNPEATFCNPRTLEDLKVALAHQELMFDIVGMTEEQLRQAGYSEEDIQNINYMWHEITDCLAYMEANGDLLQ